MSISVRQTINSSLQMLGMIRTGTNAGEDDGNACLIKLNQVIGQLNSLELLPFARKTIVYPIVASKDTYTIGSDPSADINDVRPCFIKSVFYQNSPTNRPLMLDGLDISDLIANKTYTAGRPCAFASDGGYPLTSIMFDRLLQGGDIITIVYNQELPQVGINDNIVAPVEYSDLIITALARAFGIVKGLPTDRMQKIDVAYKEAKLRVERNNGRRATPLMSRVGVQDIYTYDALGY